MKNISENLHDIHTLINKYAKDYQRKLETINLLCVSKTKPMEMIIEAYNQGERHFGESYAVEASEKIQKLKEMGYTDIVWHFIGPIQKNKTKLIAENFDIVESIDRPIVAQRINAQRPEGLKPIECLIQVNISDEGQKSGCSLSDVDELIKTIQECKNLKLRGFMGIGKDTENTNEIDEEFAQLENLFNKYKQSLENFDILSLGMTHDMGIAIKHNSTQVRIGTAIFGAREYKAKAMSTKISFIGGGNMSSCIFKSIIQTVDAKNVTVSGPHLEKLEHFKNDGANILSNNIEAIKDADIVFLGVKPQILTSVLEEIKNSNLDISNKLFVSMAAGFKLDSISKIINTKRIIRIMPNTPAKIGLGVIAIAYSNDVNQNDKDTCKQLLSHMGTCIEGDEKALNVIGAICGCGPAFVYRFMEALINEAKLNGISDADARKMVEQTVFGSASLVINEQDTSIAALREAVTSKDGTTFAGLCKMTEGKFDETMHNTIEASLARTYEFEKMF